MINAEEHNSFIFGDIKIRNLDELVKVLEDDNNSERAKMHVTNEKNDFSNWIKDVLKEEKLAKDISEQKDIPSIMGTIKTFLKNQNTAQNNNENILFNDKKEDIAQVHHQKKVDLELKFDDKKYLEEKKNNEKMNLHINNRLHHHSEILNKAGNARHFCPKFFDCMRKEFLFGFGLGIIVGLIIAIFLKIETFRQFI